MIQRSIRDGGSRDLFIKRFGKPIESYNSFQRATETLKENTVKSYLQQMPFYFLFLGQDPDAVVAQRKLDIVSVDDDERYEKLTQLYVKSLVEKGYAGFYITSMLSRIQGFYANNGKRLALDLRRLKVPKARRQKKYSPSNEDVRVLFNKADSARDKLIIALMYQNGPAPMDVSLLRCGDYPRLPWQYFERSRSKTGEVWRGISTPDVCDCLNAYLNVRGNFNADDPLFVGREGPLDSTSITLLLLRLIDKTPLGKIPGFKPTSLRDAFEDALVDCETYSKIKEALMGHNSGIEQAYGGYNKMVEKLAAAMKKVYPLICLNDTSKAENALDGISKADVDEMLELFRWVREEVKNGNLVNINNPEIIDRLKTMGKIK